MEEETQQLKCACVQCGHVISYQAAAIGQIVLCPTCGSKSQLPAPPPQPKPHPMEDESGLSDQSLPPTCPTCGDRLGKQVFCYKCESKRRRKRAMLVGIAVGTVGLIAAAGAGVVLVRAAMERRKLPPPAYTVEGAPTGPLPQPKVRLPMPKSLDNLQARGFVVQKRGTDNVSLIVGDIVNISDNLHRNVSVELEVLDAQGTIVATLKDSIVVIGGNESWHIVSRTSDPRAMGVRVARLREGP